MDPVIEAPAPVFEALTRLAFKTGPAPEANVLIDGVRQAWIAELGKAVNYEVVLTGRTWSYVRQTLAPRLALYLRHKGYRVRECQPVFLSLFLDETLYFVRAMDFYEQLRLSEELSPEAFDAVAHRWEETGRYELLTLPMSGAGKEGAS